MTDYDLHSKVPIAGFYTDDGPRIELGAIQTVPEGTAIYADEPVFDEAYTRQARVSLTAREAEAVAHALLEMAERVSQPTDT